MPAVGLRAAISAAAIAAGLSGASALNYDVNYVQTPPVIDGSADAAWATASPAATNFVKHDDVTSPSLEQTQVRALWSDTHLYLHFEAVDSFTSPSAQGNETRFFFSGSDNAEFFFDPSWTQGTAAAQNNKVYHIIVDPAPSAYVYTESGNAQLEWDLSNASQVAFQQGSGTWTVEAAIAWEDFDSTGSLSPGILRRAPINGTIWGAQFGRVHSIDQPNPNNAAFTKWNPTSGSFRQRPLGTITFKGGPAPTKVDISTGTVTYSTSFEAPTFTNGSTVSGIEGWALGTGTASTFSASNEMNHTGSQALKITPISAAQTLNHVQHTTNTVTPQYMQYALRLPREQVLSGSYRHVVYLQGAFSSGAAIDAIGQLWFRNNTTVGSNSVAVISSENPTNETATSTTEIAGIAAYDTWMYVTFKVHPAEKKFEVWINDFQLSMPDGTTMFGVRRKSAFQQLAYGQIYGKNYGTDAVFVDDVTYAEETQPSGVGDWQLF